MDVCWEGIPTIELIDMFALGTSCPAMVGKPKIFIIQVFWILKTLKSYSAKIFWYGIYKWTIKTIAINYTFRRAEVAIPMISLTINNPLHRHDWFVSVNIYMAPGILNDDIIIVINCHNSFYILKMNRICKKMLDDYRLLRNHVSLFWTLQYRYAFVLWN